MLRIGIDLGGTKTEIIALDDSGKALLRRREPTPSGDYSALLALIERMVHTAEAELGLQGSVGIGMPGAISRRTGLVKNANTVMLNGRPLGHDLQERLGREVRLANDANCLAVSEATDGAGADAEVVFAVILGTGVGGGLIVRRRLVEGANSIAGEWGHNPLPSASQRTDPGDPVSRACALAEVHGPECYCGRWGCIETWLSGPGFLADYRRSLQPLRDATSEPASARELALLLDSGDPLARSAFARYVDRLARAIAMVINVVDPGVVVMGGGMSRLSGLLPAVTARLPAYVFSDEVTTQLRLSEHGDSSGVRGAAWLWHQGPNRHWT